MVVGPARPLWICDLMMERLDIPTYVKNSKVWEVQFFDSFGSEMTGILLFSNVKLYGDIWWGFDKIPENEKATAQLKTWQSGMFFPMGLKCNTETEKILVEIRRTSRVDRQVEMNYKWGGLVAPLDFNGHDIPNAPGKTILNRDNTRSFDCW